MPDKHDNIKTSSNEKGNEPHLSLPADLILSTCLWPIELNCPKGAGAVSPVDGKWKGSVEGTQMCNMKYNEYGLLGLCNFSSFQFNVGILCHPGWPHFITVAPASWVSQTLPPQALTAHYPDPLAAYRYPTPSETYPPSTHWAP